MTKSLDKFPRETKGFSLKSYGHDVRMAVAAESPYNGVVGLELELEGVGLPENYRGRSVGGASWVYHNDGSLRAVGGRAPGGAEYVLSQPCEVAEVPELCDNLFAYIAEQGGTIQNSTRCSTHVHLNMKGAKLNQICSFVGLWGTFEDVLANWCGRHRSGNHFALRLRDSEVAVAAWEKAFKTGSFAFSREQRYLALNPACLNTFGSLEVRTMRGVEGSAEVVTWVEALAKLRELSRSEEYENPTVIANNLSAMGARGFFESVFGDLRIFQDLEQKTVDLGESVDELVRDGFRRVQPILYTLPWGDVIPETKKPFVPDPFGGKTKARARVAPPMPDLNWEAPRPAAPRIRVPQPAPRPFEIGQSVMYVGPGENRARTGTVMDIGANLMIVRWDHNGQRSGTLEIGSFVPN